MIRTFTISVLFSLLSVLPVSAQTKHITLDLQNTIAIASDSIYLQLSCYPALRTHG